MLKMVLWQAPVSPKNEEKKKGQKKGTPDAELVIGTTDCVTCAPWGNPVAQLTLGTMQQRECIPVMTRALWIHEKCCSAEYTPGNCEIKEAIQLTPWV